MDIKNVKREDGFKMNGNWPVQSKNLKDQYPILTDADLKYETGNEEELLARLGQRLDKTRREVIEIINNGQRSAYKITL